MKAEIRGYIRDQLNTSNLITDVQNAVRDRADVLHDGVNSAIDSAFAELNRAMREVLSSALAGVDESINGILGPLGDRLGAGQIDGYARINNDSLEVLRLDGAFRWEVPEPIEFNGFLEIASQQSQGTGSCYYNPLDTYEVTVGAQNVPVSWNGTGIQANVGLKLNIDTSTSPPTPLGAGGFFTMEDGSLKFESAEITRMDGTAMFSLAGAGSTEIGEAYLGMAADFRFSGSGLGGGVFFGKACSPDPIELIDPQVAEVLGDLTTFEGGYLYGEGRFPLVDFGCIFRISCSAGVGFFYFTDGPTYGGRIAAGVSGEALCAVGVSGSISLVGVKSGRDYRFNGRGRVAGKAGACPICVRFGKTVTLTYENGSWDADY